jgi:hypothetical protein
MSWTDRIVGARMSQDREFGDRVAQSSLSHQEWNLVMTATEFRIEDPDDPDRARLVGDTSKLPSVIPEMDRIASEQPDAQRQQSSDGGVFGSIKSALGMGGGGGSGDDERTEAAEELVDEYTTQLQRRLEDRGRWAEVRQAAAEERDRE